MSDRTPYERGAEAYDSGAPISVIPEGMSLDDYEEYRQGWKAAWDAASLAGETPP